MESCSTVLETQGGPPSLVTKTVASTGNGHYYNLVKLSENRFRVETMKATASIEDKNLDDPIFVINGK